MWCQWRQYGGMPGLNAWNAWNAKEGSCTLCTGTGTGTGNSTAHCTLHRQYTSRPKAGLRQPSQEADTQSGLLCKGYRLRWKNDLFPKSKKPFPLTPGADGNSRLGSQDNWGNFRAFWRVCRLDTHTLHRQYFGHSRCLRQMKCWNGISEKQKVWWDENCRNHTGSSTTQLQIDSLKNRLLTVASMAFTRIPRLTSSTLTPNSILILMRQVQNCR